MESILPKFQDDAMPFSLEEAHTVLLNYVSHDKLQSFEAKHYVIAEIYPDEPKESRCHILRPGNIDMTLDRGISQTASFTSPYKWIADLRKQGRSPSLYLLHGTPAEAELMVSCVQASPHRVVEQLKLNVLTKPVKTFDPFEL